MCDDSSVSAQNVQLLSLVWNEGELGALPAQVIFRVFSLDLLYHPHSDDSPTYQDGNIEPVNERRLCLFFPFSQWLSPVTLYIAMCSDQILSSSLYFTMKATTCSGNISTRWAWKSILVLNLDVGCILCKDVSVM